MRRKMNDTPKDISPSIDRVPSPEGADKLGSPLGMRLMAFTLRVLPARVTYLMAALPVIWYYVIRGKGRRAAALLHERLGLKGGRLSRFRFGFRQALAFSRVILDNMMLGIVGPERFCIEEQGTEIFQQLLGQGRGLVLLSAHVGNWHLAVNFLWNTGTHVHLVIDDARHEEVRRQMDRAKADSRHLTVHGVTGDPNMVFTLSQALRRGEVVIIAGDRSRPGGRRVKVRFLGEDAWFPTSGLAVAVAVGAPVCTALSFRTGPWRYCCHGLGPFSSGAASGDRADRVGAMAREFAAHLETFVRRYPTQWFNFYDFWKEE